ncbi:hypothetical protein ACFLS9_09155 [Bacteroidota bacterium]
MKENKNLFRELTNSELIDYSRKMSTLRIDIDNLEISKKGRVEEFNSSIKAKENELLEIARKVKRGGVEEDVECEVELNKPLDGMKTIKRLDSGLEWTEDMEAIDYKLDFSDEKLSKHFADKVQEQVRESGIDNVEIKAITEADEETRLEPEEN